MKKIDLSAYQSEIPLKHKLLRALWNIAWFLLARPFPRRIANGWKLCLLRLFGAKVHSKSVVYSSARIYMPWNLEMHEYSCLAPQVHCYNPAKVSIGAHATVSQKTYLCAASHDVTKVNYPLILAPITVQDQVWVGADAFIGMGVTIGQGAVVGAKSAVFKDVEPWTIVGGNPVKFIKKRIVE